ncbi:MAG TPA: CapA family protein [Clostridiales bacterium]|nr:CapA family protein [Clostridiales bacterium]
MKEKIKIIIAADLVPTQSNIEYFKTKNMDALIGHELVTLLKSADIRIFNLEAPITERRDKIIKSGPHLKIDPVAINGIIELNPSVLSLANNHIKDYGENGIRDTIDYLRNNDIPYVGVGENIDKAREGVTITIKGHIISVISFAEHEFSIARDNQCGANPYDPLTSFDDVKRIAERSDYVIVLFHGGKEHYRYPTVEQKRICNKFLSVGANIVVCQHSHCIGAAENINGGVAVYGQGNFIFNLCDDERWKSSLLIEIELCELSSISYIPIVKCGATIRIANEEEAIHIIDGFESRCKEILEEGFLEKNQKIAAKRAANYYLKKLHGAGFFFRVLDKILSGRIIRYIYRHSSIRAELLNCIECETHREFITDYLRNSLID